MSKSRIEVQDLSPDQFERVMKRQVEKAFENHINHIEDLKSLTREARGVLGRKEVMDYLGVRKDALRRFEIELDLPFYCPGGKVKYYFLEEIKDWLRQYPGEIDPNEDAPDEGD